MAQRKVPGHLRPLVPSWEEDETAVVVRAARRLPAGGWRGRLAARGLPALRPPGRAAALCPAGSVTSGRLDGVLLLRRLYRW